MDKFKDETNLVFQDKWCQIWYNPFLETVAVNSIDDNGLGVVLSVSEWWAASAKILGIRNGTAPAEIQEALPELECPKIEAKLSRDKKIFTIVCPFCRQEHTHGAGDNGDLYGHRVAHCSYGVANHQGLGRGAARHRRSRTSRDGRSLSAVRGDGRDEPNDVSGIYRTKSKTSRQMKRICNCTENQSRGKCGHSSQVSAL